MRTFLGVVALGLGLLLASPAAAQNTQQNQTVTQTVGNQGNGSAWFSWLTTPRMRFESMFNPFRPVGPPQGVTFTVPDPSNNAYYLQQFGYSRPGRR